MDNQDRFYPELQLVEHEWTDPRAETERRRREALLAAEVLSLLALTDDQSEADSGTAYLN